MDALRRAGSTLGPPIDRTCPVDPVPRALAPKTSYLIEHGQGAVFRLPNGALVGIDAG